MWLLWSAGGWHHRAVIPTHGCASSGLLLEQPQSSRQSYEACSALLAVLPRGWRRCASGRRMQQLYAASELHVALRSACGHDVHVRLGPAGCCSVEMKRPSAGCGHENSDGPNWMGSTTAVPSRPREGDRASRPAEELLRGMPPGDRSGLRVGVPGCTCWAAQASVSLAIVFDGFGAAVPAAGHHPTLHPIPRQSRFEPSTMGYRHGTRMVSQRCHVRTAPACCRVSRWCCAPAREPPEGR